jgi:hypothetical protein
MMKRPGLLSALWASLGLMAAAAPIDLPKSLPPAAATTTPSAIPWLDASGFLPVREPGRNAVELYAEAVGHIRKTPGFPSLGGSAEDREKQPELREALRCAFDAAHLAEADFLKVYSYRAWEDGGTPDLLGAMAVVQALSRSATRFAEAGQNEHAMTAAQAAVSMGDHYLRGAPNLAQALMGQAMLKEGMRTLRHCYMQASDSDKAREAAERIAAARPSEPAVEVRSAAAAVARWGDGRAALRALSDPDPIIRSDAVLLIEACVHPEGFDWMRSDEEISVIATRVRALRLEGREAVAALKGDGDPTVRRLAERVLGVFESGK